MRIVFAGTPAFAAIVLARLLDARHDVVLVLTRPDRPGGRGLKLLPSPVKQLAETCKLEIFQPADATDHEYHRRVIDRGRCVGA